MSVVTAGEITTSLGGLILTFTDQTTGIGTLVSRTLQIYDYNGNLVQTYNMGTNTTQAYPITTDQWLQFVETIIDNTGTYVLTINYLAQGIYTSTFLNVIKKVGCSCNCSHETYQELSVGELFLAAANRFALGGFSVSSENNIVAANTFITP